jgi:hypothetical protein
MNTNNLSPESNDLYTRDYLIRVPYVQPQQKDSSRIPGFPIWVPLMLSCLSIVVMVVYLLKTNRIMVLDFSTGILLLITGIVSFAMVHIFGTIFFGDK